MEVKTTLEAIMNELSVLAGARLQRVDVVDERELVLELRVPGHTFRLLVSARAGAARVYLVPCRPERVIPAGALQGFLRQRLVGQKLAEIGLERRCVRLIFENDTLELNLQGGRRALVVETGGREPPSAIPFADLPPFIHNAVAERDFLQRAPEAEDKRLRELLTRGLNTDRKRLRKLLKNLEGDHQRLEKYAEEAHRGELLKTVLGKVKRGDNEFKAWDWLSGSEVKVALDPRLSPKANMQRFFDRAKKAHRGLPRVNERLSEVMDKIEDIDIQLLELETMSGASLRSAIEETGLSSLDGFGRIVKPAKAGEKSPIERVARRFQAVDGTEMWVGRGAVANDRLTFSFSKGDDVWLHARGTSGAHVILRADKGKTPAPEALLDAAHLAIHNSSQQHEHKAEVMVAQVRFVKKTKGAAPGLVGVSSSRTLLVRMEPERIARLYKK